MRVCAKLKFFGGNAGENVLGLETTLREWRRKLFVQCTIRAVAVLVGNNRRDRSSCVGPHFSFVSASLKFFRCPSNPKKISATESRIFVETSHTDFLSHTFPPTPRLSRLSYIMPSLRSSVEVGAAVSNALECQVCLLRYETHTGGARSPYLLSPCGHSLCRDCANQVPDCPFCRQPIVHRCCNRGLLDVAIAIDDSAENINNATDVRAAELATPLLSQQNCVRTASPWQFSCTPLLDLCSSIDLLDLIRTYGFPMLIVTVNSVTLFGLCMPMNRKTTAVQSYLVFCVLRIVFILCACRLHLSRIWRRICGMTTRMLIFLFLMSCVFSAFYLAADLLGKIYDTSSWRHEYWIFADVGVSVCLLAIFSFSLFVFMLMCRQRERMRERERLRQQLPEWAIDMYMNMLRSQSHWSYGFPFHVDRDSYDLGSSSCPGLDFLMAAVDSSFFVYAFSSIVGWNWMQLTVHSLSMHFHPLWVGMMGWWADVKVTYDGMMG